LHETAKNEEEANFLKQIVFERINSGGVKLEDQEARNAIYNGPLNQLCIRLARNGSLCELWGIPKPDAAEVSKKKVREAVLRNELYRSMTDVELVLRFFAYRQRRASQRGSLKQYLDTYQRIGNRFDENVLRNLEQLFVATIKLAADLFGPSAFWLPRRRAGDFTWYRRPTTVVYDPMMFALSHFTNERSHLPFDENTVKERLFNFYSEHSDKFEGRYTNRSNMNERNDLFLNFFANIL
jgi:hypothetical protein